MDRAGDSMNPLKPVEIGLEQIYNLVLSVDTKVDTYIGMQEPRLVLFDHRLTQVETKMKESEVRWEAKTKEISDRRWQVTLAFIAAGLSVMGTVVLGLLQVMGK